MLSLLPKFLKFGSDKAEENPKVSNALAALAVAYFGLDASQVAAALRAVADLIS
jgi:hypothetical protein|tara:strand:- start:94 stop:255 length:162 start_codon:yes stop_codon:yes gene_type:complete